MKPDELLNECIDRTAEYADMVDDPLERLIIASRYLASMHLEIVGYAEFLEKRVLELEEKLYATNRC
jgi:hypothetical protein